MKKNIVYITGNKMDLLNPKRALSSRTLPKLRVLRSLLKTRRVGKETSLSFVPRNSFIFGSPVHSRSSSQWSSLVVEKWIPGSVLGRRSDCAAERGSRARAGRAGRPARPQTYTDWNPPTSECQTTPPTGQALQKEITKI